MSPVNLLLKITYSIAVTINTLRLCHSGSCILAQQIPCALKLKPNLFGGILVLNEWWLRKCLWLSSVVVCSVYKRYPRGGQVGTEPESHTTAKNVVLSSFYIQPSSILSDSLTVVLAWNSSIL